MQEFEANNIAIGFALPEVIRLKIFCMIRANFIPLGISASVQDASFLRPLIKRDTPGKIIFQKRGALAMQRIPSLALAENGVCCAYTHVEEIVGRLRERGAGGELEVQRMIRYFQKE